jgi:tetratricopeptide (TPR) repeat protein
MKSKLLVVGFSMLLILIARADEKTPDSSAAGESEHWLFGRWKGLSGIWLHGSSHGLPPVIVELDLRPGSADGTLEGTRKAHVANTRQIFYGDAASTTAEVHGEYDDLTQSVRLIAETYEVTRFVFDAETNTLAGCLDRPAELSETDAKPGAAKPSAYSHFHPEREPFPYFVLWRDARADQLVEDYLTKLSAYRELRSATGNTQFGARGAASSASEQPADSQDQWQPPSIDKLIEWAAAVSKRGNLGKAIENLSLPAAIYGRLFEDNYFSSYFGKRYDELTASDLRAIYKQFGTPNRAATLLPANLRPSREEYRYLEDIFNGPDPRVIASVNWWRAVSRWTSTAEKSVSNLPATGEGRSHLEFAEAAAAAEFSSLWPDEREKLNRTIAAAHTRLAGAGVNATPPQLAGKDAGPATKGVEQLPTASEGKRQATEYYERALAEQKKAEASKIEADYKSAIQDYKHCLQLDPRNTDAYIKLGDCYRGVSKYADAQREYDRAIQFSPEAKALLDHSIEKEKTRYCYAAIHDLDELTKMEPNNAALYYRKANLYLMDHASEQANENFKKASQLEPTNLQYGLRASHPVPPSHQLTAEQMMDNLITGAAVVGGAIVGAALLADKMAIDDSKRIVAESGGKKKLCPVCKGRKSLMVFDTPPPAMNPHRWGTQEYELFELQQKYKTTMRTADCDECHGTGVVDN